MDYFSLTPVYLQVAILFGFGVIIGSFLNVVLYRLHTGKSLSGHSHCMSCGKRLRALELVPLLSYLVLRGRCKACHSYIPVRYFLVELLTGLTFVAVLLSSQDLIGLTFGLTLMSLLIVVAVYDLRHLIIPDELILQLTTLAMLYAGYQLYQTSSPSVFAYNIGAAFLGSLFFYLLWHASAGKWIGFGDVKLAFPLGLFLGYGGVFSMIVLAFWVGASIGLILLLLGHIVGKRKKSLRFFGQKLTMKSALPFAPFLITGFLLVWFFRVDVVALLTYAY